jgi:hypothetical protein
MRKAGATIVDVRFPKWLLDSKLEFYNAIRMILRALAIFEAPTLPHAL